MYKAEDFVKDGILYEKDGLLLIMIVWEDVLNIHQTNVIAIMHIGQK